MSWSAAGGRLFICIEGFSPEELVRAVREASLGRRYLAPPLSDRAVEAYLHRSEDSRLEPYDMLTPESARCCTCGAGIDQFKYSGKAFHQPSYRGGASGKGHAEARIAQPHGVDPLRHQARIIPEK
jgi:hypothetical protein